MGSQPRLIEVRKNVLKQNDLTARALREQFRAAGVFVVSLVSSPGRARHVFGKDAHSAPSALPRSRACRRSRYRERCHPIGPLPARLSKITTGTLCHLEAAMVENALQEWISTNLISCLLKMLATWSVLRPTTLARIFGLFSSR